MHGLRLTRCSRSAAFLLVALGILSPKWLHGAEIVPVSVAADLGSLEGSRGQSVSADGRLVLFESLAANVIPDQIDPTETGEIPFFFLCDYGGGPEHLCTDVGDYDVFVVDRENGETELISHVEGEPARTRSFASKSFMISADGSHVVYSNFRLDDEAPFLREELVLYDRAADTATVFAASSADESFRIEASISHGGETVVFTGFDPAFAEGNSGRDLYLFDRNTGAIELISAAVGTPNTTANNPSPAIVSAWSRGAPRAFDLSATGDRVVFVSRASDLVVDEGNGLIKDIFLYRRSTGTVSAVSRRPAGGTANRQSDKPSISDDGSLVAFESEASNLIGGFVDGNAASDSDIFLYAPDTDTMVLVSHAVGSPTQSGNGESFDPMISSDGRYVAFASNATDLVDGFVDNNGSAPDVYLFEVATGTIRLVSRSTTSAVQGGNAESRRPRIDNSAGALLFESRATDLLPGFVDGNGEGDYDLFVFSAARQTIRLASRSMDATATSANAGPGAPVLSGDGTSVAYQSAATDVVAPMADVVDLEVFAFDLDTETTSVLASASLLAEPSATGDGRSGFSTGVLSDLPPAAAISHDGRFTTFESTANNLVADLTDNGSSGVYLYDRDTGENRLVSHFPGAPNDEASGLLPRISGDGGWVTFLNDSDPLVPGFVDNNNGRDIFLFERTSGTIQLVSRSLAGPTSSGNDRSLAPSLSADGAWILFQSFASDLVAGFVDNNGEFASDTFLFDRSNGSIELISHAAANPAAGANGSTGGSISADGRHVTLGTEATDLLPDFINSGAPDTRNVVLVDRMSDDRILVSHAASNPNTGADDDSNSIALSEDGQHLLLSSRASNLIDGFVDANGNNSDLYLWDRAAGTNQLISRSTIGPAVGGNNRTGGAALSRDGAWIAFESAATDLLDGFADRNGNGAFDTDVFLLEVATGTVTLVSRATEGPRIGGNGRAALGALVEQSGTFSVYFSSEATNHVDGFTGTEDVQNLYRYDVTDGTTELISHALGDPLRGSNFDSLVVGASQEDGTVLVVSRASNLVPRDHNDVRDFFLVGENLGADLVVTKTDDIDPVSSGMGFSYTIAVENQGPSAATAVGILDTLPDGIELVSVEGAAWRCFGNLAEVGCLLRQGLAPGANAPPLTLRVLAPLAGGTIVNTATVNAAVPELDPGSNSDDETTTVIFVDLVFADGFESGDTSAWSDTVPNP